MLHLKSFVEPMLGQQPVARTLLHCNCELSPRGQIKTRYTQVTLGCHVVSFGGVSVFATIDVARIRMVYRARIHLLRLQTDGYVAVVTLEFALSDRGLVRSGTYSAKLSGGVCQVRYCTVLARYELRNLTYLWMTSGYIRK